MTPSTTIAVPSDSSTRAAAELTPVDRFRWEREVIAAHLPTDLLLLALVLATYADGRTGGNVRPGAPLLASALGWSERKLTDRMGKLIALGYLERLSRGGGPRGLAALYQLTAPVDVLTVDDEATGTPAESSTPVAPVPHRTPARSRTRRAAVPPAAAATVTELPQIRGRTPASDPPLTCGDETHQRPKNYPPTPRRAATAPPRPAATPEDGKPHNSPTDTAGYARHRHHDNAARWCQRVTRERRLPMSAGQLLGWCYRAGNGDPWTGHRAVDQATDRELDTAVNPAAALLARLRTLGGEPTSSATPRPVDAITNAYADAFGYGTPTARGAHFVA
jgi:hypothetical protein